jgi:GT2 family glycosyltransferase
MPSPNPCVTVSLVTYQGAHWLHGCLRTLAEQTFGDFEVLALDNFSSDGSPDLLTEFAASDDRFVVRRSDVNLGYAAGHNRNLREARGEFVVLLNQDMELDRHFLEEVVRAFGNDPSIGAVQARIHRLGSDGTRKDLLDTAGLVMQRDRRFVSRGQGELAGSGFDREEEIFGADGPAPVYRRLALDDARVPRRDGSWEVLDEDFFMYKEDVDLAWRLQRLGWRTRYAPAAVAWHARGAGGPKAVTMFDIARTNWAIRRWIKALSWRNQRLMQLKNDSFADYVADLPWIARREALSWAFILLADPPRLIAVPTLLSSLPAILRKRRYLVHRYHARFALGTPASWARGHPVSTLRTHMVRTGSDDELDADLLPTVGETDPVRAVV